MADKKDRKSLSQREAELAIEQEKLDLLIEQEKVTREMSRIKQSEIYNKVDSLLGEIISKKNEIAALDLQLKDLGALTAENYEEQKKLLEQKAKIAEELRDIDEEILEKAEAHLETIRQQNEVLKTQQELEDKINAKTKDLILSTGLVSDNWKNGLLSMLAQSKQVDNLNGGISSMLEATDELVTPSNALAAGLNEIVKASVVMFERMDDGQASYVQQTGLTRDNAIQTQEMALQHRFLGMNMQNSLDAITALTEKYSNFNDLSSESQQLVATNVSLLTNLGVSAGTAAGIYADLNKMYGMNVDQTHQMSKELLGLVGPGATAAQIFEGFESSLTTLGRYSGPKAIEVYKGLVSQSKALQISTESLLSIAGQFDTFEGAATSVGKLNALLGGDYLNSVEMLSASEEERIQMMNRAMNVSGKQWNSMNKFEKMAIANAAGISDMTEANKLFGTSMYDVEQQMLQDRGRQKTQEQFEELMRDAQTLKEDFLSVAQSFAFVWQPVIDTLKDVMTWYGELDSETRKITDGLVGMGVPVALVVTGLAGIYKISRLLTAGKHLVTIAGNMSTLAASSVATGATTPVAATGITAVNTAGKGGAAGGAGLAKLAVGLLAAGAAGLLIGVGLNEASKGAERFFGTLKTVDGDDVAVLAGLLATLTAFGAGGALAVAGAGALVALGAGLALFGEGLESTVEGTAQLVELLEQIGKLTSQKIELFQKVAEGSANMSSTGGGSISGAISRVTNINKTSTINAGSGTTHKIVLVDRDKFGNERELKEFVVDVVNNQLNFRGNV